ncbi:MAG: glutamine-hydrolyzing GMP synthase [Actinobacteria bacterium]|nr:glutamine-hydrolyzing GMP synthase [Actinomycetota bacterium]
MASPAGQASTGDFDKIIVIDFGAQYAQLIARRVREAHVFSEIVPRDISAQQVRDRGPVGIILSGGPASVYVDGAPELDPEIFELGIPILGICYGHQVMAQALGGVVESNDVAEYGRTEISVEPGSAIFRDLPDRQDVWMSHRDAVVRAPEGFDVVATTADSPVAAMANRERQLYGVQFHPEVGHTPRGQELFKNFLYNVCDVRPNWTHVSIIERSVEAVREAVGDAQVICGLSGGVDSSVAAALVHKAIGDQLVCVFVDHGLMREGEAEQVEATFGAAFHMNLIHVKVQDRFLDRLAGVTDPEEKRKAIGETFIRVFEEVAADIDGARFLVQGTLYPDVIESGTKDAAKIKSHHNVGGLPDDMTFELIEPLRDLFKDEVRAIGEELGLPAEIVQRQPFPGPGLGVRIIGEVTRERLDILRAADVIVLEEVRRAGLYNELWQSFAVLPAIRSVGVQGDERTYAYPIVIRAVTSDDAMTADWARIPFDVLERMSSRVINEVPGINRVTYDITSKPPGTIEWE